MYNTAADVLNKWLNGVNQGDLDTVAAMYSTDAVLLPTFSNHIRNTPAARRDYFEGLARNDDVKVELHQKTLRTQDLGDGIYCMGGIYCWTFAIDGEPLHFEARFTYAIDLKLENPILHHHSSQVPRGL